MIQLVKPSRGHITQVYGARQVDGNPHAGTDFAYSNSQGEIFPEVYAAGDGVVLFAGDARGLSWPNIMYLNPDFNRNDNVDSSAGNYTILAHYDAGGRQVALTGYGHQEEIWVKAGDTVRAGQRIGTVGATGFSAGKHLHFDLVLFPFDVDDAPYYGRVDPSPYFTGSISYAAESINPLQEEDIMAIIDDVANVIMRDDVLEAIAKRVHTRPLPYYIDGKETGQATTVAAMVGNYDSNLLVTWRIVADTVAATVRAIFNTAIDRAGGSLGGQTTLAAVLAYFDASVEGIVNEYKANPGAGIDQAKVTAAIQAAADEAMSGYSLTLTRDAERTGEN